MATRSRLTACRVRWFEHRAPPASAILTFPEQSIGRTKRRWPRICGSVRWSMRPVAARTTPMATGGSRGGRSPQVMGTLYVFGREYAFVPSTTVDAGEPATIRARYAHVGQRLRSAQTVPVYFPGAGLSKQPVRYRHRLASRSGHRHLGQRCAIPLLGRAAVVRAPLQRRLARQPGLRSLHQLSVHRLRPPLRQRGPTRWSRWCRIE